MAVQVNGNYRTSLAGCDLNRKWKNPDPTKHPTIYHTKELIRSTKRWRTVGLIMDLHGHSRKQGIFVYGCVPDKRMMRSSSPNILPHGPIDESGLSSKPSLVQVKRQCVAFGSKIVQDQPQRQHAVFQEQNSQLNAAHTLDHPSHNTIPGRSDEVMTQRKDVGWTRENSDQVPTGESCGNTLTDDSSAKEDLAAYRQKPKDVLPGDHCSSRDVCAWRVQLLPRLFQETTPAFSFQNCR